MRFEVLGPVRGWRGEDELELGSPQQRLLLAALLLARGRALSMAQLVDVLWGTRPPRQAVGTVQTYVSRLRAVLGREALASVDDGYLLRPAELDADAAEAALSRARDAGPEERVALLSGALALYGSEPL
ncbi:MAG: AfsR family transcriptional regulator, partial [Nonomuraea sp.]|nr:AfsR family transcriptional regulator [Nonomuraea sp.]